MDKAQKPEKFLLPTAKRTKLWLALALALALVISISAGSAVAMAYHQTQTEQRANIFTVGNVSVTLEEPNFPLNAPDRTTYAGREFQKDPTVTNTGSTPAYLFLEVMMPRAIVRTVTPGASASDPDVVNAAVPQDLFSYDYDDAHWILLDDPEVSRLSEDGLFMIYMYGYSKIAQPGQVCEPLFSTVKFLNMLQGELPMDQELEIEIAAGAIQADNLGAQGDTFKEELMNVLSILY